MGAPKTASVRWRSSDANAGSFLIDRSTDGVNYTPLTTVLNQSSSEYIYHDTTIVAGSTYYYKLRSTALTATSSQYHTASITVPTTTRPDNFPMLFWFKASSLDGVLSDGGRVGEPTGSMWMDSYPYNLNPDEGHRKVIHFSASMSGSIPMYLANGGGAGISMIRFDTDDYLLVPSFDLAPPYSFAVMYRGPGPTATDAGIFCNPTTYGDNFRIFCDGERKIGVYANNTNKSTLFSSSVSMSQVAWINCPTNSFEWYENGYQRASSSGQSTVNITMGPMKAMGSFWSYAGGLSASLYEVCVWSASLTSADISDLFNSYIIPTYGSVFYTSSA